MLEETIGVINLLCTYSTLLEEITLKEKVYTDFIKEFTYDYADPSEHKDWVTSGSVIIRRGK